jgi:hypothetical protein
MSLVIFTVGSLGELPTSVRGMKSAADSGSVLDASTPIAPATRSPLVVENMYMFCPIQTLRAFLQRLLREARQSLC